MEPKTLYDVVKPICWKLNAFGFNFGNEKPAGCSRRAYKLAVKCTLLYLMWKLLISQCTLESKYRAYFFGWLNGTLLITSTFSMYFFCVKEEEMERMIMRLKKQPLGTASEKRISQQQIPFKIFSKLFNIFSFVSTLVVCLIFLIDALPIYLSLLHCAFLESAIFTLQFPTLLCNLPCIVAGYCRAEIEEAIAEMKRLKSPLRRVKTSVKLIEKYQQLYELASLTDRVLSTAMCYMKWPFLIAIATSAMICSELLLDKHPDVAGQLAAVLLFSVAISILVILTYFPLLQYLYSAPSANQMSSLMNRAMAEVVSIDDERLSRDPILISYLLHMRMKQVERLNEVASEDPPFTLFGDVVDEDALCMLVLEIVDMWNTLSVHDEEEEMKPNRILRNFMEQQCSFNCSYWKRF